LGVAVSIGATLLGAFLGRKAVSAATVGRAGTAVRSMSRAYKESQDVARASETVEAMEQQRADIEAQFQAEAAALQSSLDPASAALETIVVRPKKTAITVRLVALGWAPYRDNQPAWS
jgi:Skp family chaperone for outer membrane proteins